MEKGHVWCHVHQPRVVHPQLEAKIHSYREDVWPSFIKAEHGQNIESTRDEKEEESFEEVSMIRVENMSNQTNQDERSQDHDRSTKPDTEKHPAKTVENILITILLLLR